MVFKYKIVFSNTYFKYMYLKYCPSLGTTYRFQNISAGLCVYRVYIFISYKMHLSYAAVKRFIVVAYGDDLFSGTNNNECRI